MYISNHYFLTYFPSILEAKVTLHIWKAEADRDECGGVVERRLHRVHVRPGEGGRVVGLVVEGVTLPIQSEPNILFLFGT